MILTHKHLQNLKSLTEEFDLLIDNEEYYDHHFVENPEDYLVVYSYLTDLTTIATELITHGIEFQHLNCPLSDESFLLINYKQK